MYANGNDVIMNHGSTTDIFTDSLNQIVFA